jgi:hypothetical protein
MTWFLVVINDILWNLTPIGSFQTQCDTSHGVKRGAFVNRWMKFQAESQNVVWASAFVSGLGQMKKDWGGRRLARDSGCRGRVFRETTGKKPRITLV